MKFLTKSRKKLVRVNFPETTFKPNFLLPIEPLCFPASVKLKYKITGNVRVKKPINSAAVVSMLSNLTSNSLEMRSVVPSNKPIYIRIMR